ncbi:hypothetical protein JCM6882_008792 [Rhodosporidiobolus microsporus]
MSAPPQGRSNWHWRTKGVETWARDYWKEQLAGIEADGVVVDEVTDVEGDCELGMRKSKLVTIYDMRLTIRWKATDSAGEDVTGNLVAPEVAHDMDEDEYRFETSLLSGSGPEAEKFRLTSKKALADKLRSKFQQFPKDMIAFHGKDLLAAAAADSPSGSGASTPSAPAPSAPAPAAAAAKSAAKPATVNTATVRATGEFQCDAATLYDFLTRADKVPMWSRNPAQIEPTEGAEVVLFGGNIRGKVVKAEPPKLFTMSWRAPTWPEDHYGQLETTLEQGSNSTTLNLKLSGVPIGKEDEAESNLHAYYIRGLQSIGLGLVSFSSESAASPAPSTKSAPSRRSQQQQKKQTKSSSIVNRWTLANVGSFAVSFGLIAALGAAFYYGPSGPGGKKP